MKTTIVAFNKTHLKELIQDEINRNGNRCSLNHIDVSNITDMSYLFVNSRFNGSISKWDVSNVENMFGMFMNSNFNQNISKWDTSKVKNMSYLFKDTYFNQDISKWDTSSAIEMASMFKGSQFNSNISNWNISNVEYMDEMFYESDFDKDINNWKPYSLISSNILFDKLMSNIPYWAKFDNNNSIRKSIDAYHLNKELKSELSENNATIKKFKV
jgi:surface protein